jgi:DNA polymerase III alpha subunit
MMWAEAFQPARDQGLLEPGKVVRLRCSIQTDDRTGRRRLTAHEIAEMKSRKSNGSKGPLELDLSAVRHSERDLDDILSIIAAHPGKTPIVLHIHHLDGRRITIEADASFAVKRSDALLGALDPWIHDG